MVCVCEGGGEESRWGVSNQFLGRGVPWKGGSLVGGSLVGGFLGRGGRWALIGVMEEKGG